MTSIPSPSRDDLFYVETLNFMVEDTHFRVPKWGFELQGSFFADMFDVPGPGEDGAQIEGVSEEYPIVVEGVSKLEFKAFLKALYPGLYHIYSKTQAHHLVQSNKIRTYPEWVGVLHLSTMWNFPEPRKLAIDAMSQLMAETKLDMWDKIELAKKYNVRRWLLDEYLELVNSCKQLDVDALMAGGMDSSFIIKLFRLREKYVGACRACATRCRECSYYSDKLASSDIIMETFPLDFATMRDD